MNFNFFIDFWHTINENSSMTWSVSDKKILLLYYFNSKNIDLEDILLLLNVFGCQQRLSRMGWKLLFKMQNSNSETWNYEFFKRIEFYVKN